LIIVGNSKIFGFTCEIAKSFRDCMEIAKYLLNQVESNIQHHFPWNWQKRPCFSRRAVGPYGSPRFLRKPVHCARIRFQVIRWRDYECTHIDLSFSINKKVYIMICPEDSAEKYRIFVLSTWFAHCCVLITRRQRENGATKIKSFEFYHLADEQCPAGEC